MPKWFLGHEILRLRAQNDTLFTSGHSERNVLCVGRTRCAVIIEPPSGGELPKKEQPLTATMHDVDLTAAAERTEPLNVEEMTRDTEAAAPDVPAHEVVFSVKELDVYYGTFRAVKDISVEVPRGRDPETPENRHRRRLLRDLAGGRARGLPAGPPA